MYGRDKALVVYVFTESKRFLRDVVLRTSAGAVTHNDTMLHYSGTTLTYPIAVFSLWPVIHVLVHVQSVVIQDGTRWCS